MVHQSINHRLILEIGNTEWDIKMQSSNGKFLDTVSEGRSHNAYRQCRDFLCPIKSRIQEWFPTLIQARFRAKALDPFGLLRPKNQSSLESEVRIICFLECVDDRCHAFIKIQKVKPDSKGNLFGIYGCLTHQHSISREKRSEIVFKNRIEALDFFNKNLEKTFTKACTNKRLQHNIYRCRRSRLARHCGHHPCKSNFSIAPTFNTLKANPKYEEHFDNDMPYSITGSFYHSHKNDTRYHKDDLGLSKVISDKPRKRPYKQERPRFKNGKVWPLSARLAGITKEDIEKSRIYHSKGCGKTRKPKDKIKTCSDRNCTLQKCKKDHGIE